MACGQAFGWRRLPAANHVTGSPKKHTVAQRQLDEAASSAEAAAGTTAVDAVRFCHDLLLDYTCLYTRFNTLFCPFPALTSAFTSTFIFAFILLHFCLLLHSFVTHLSYLAVCLPVFLSFSFCFALISICFSFVVSHRLTLCFTLSNVFLTPPYTPSPTPMICLLTYCTSHSNQPSGLVRLTARLCC